MNGRFGKPTGKRWTWQIVAGAVTLALAAILLFGAGRSGWFAGFAAQQGETEEARGVVLIPVEYHQGSWMLGAAGPSVLACEPPASFSSPHASAPIIRFLDQKGEMVFEYSLRMDPRIILHEGPATDPFLLEDVALVLRIPLVGEPVAAELYASPDPVVEFEKKELVLKVDLTEALEKFKEQGERSGACDEPEFQPDAAAR